MPVSLIRQKSQPLSSIARPQVAVEVHAPALFFTSSSTLTRTPPAAWPPRLFPVRALDKHHHLALVIAGRHGRRSSPLVSSEAGDDRLERPALPQFDRVHRLYVVVSVNSTCGPLAASLHVAQTTGCPLPLGSPVSRSSALSPHSRSWAAAHSAALRTSALYFGSVLMLGSRSQSIRRPIACSRRLEVVQHGGRSTSGLRERFDRKTVRVRGKVENTAMVSGETDRKRVVCTRAQKGPGGGSRGVVQQLTSRRTRSRDPVFRLMGSCRCRTPRTRCRSRTGR